MRITLVGKYPPIEGGVSSRTYWLSRALGKRGIDIDIVTNAQSVEEAYREQFNFSDAIVHQEYVPKNVHVYSLRQAPPHHIPYSAGYVTRLVNLGLRVIGEKGSDLIFAHYLEPYGVSGLFLKELLNLPLAVRHAGSDIYRLLADSSYSYILGRVLTKADGVFISDNLRQFTSQLHIKSLPIPPTFVDTDFFSPYGERFDFAARGFPVNDDIPIITYIGKIGKHKGIFELLEALEDVRENFRLVLVTGGGGEESNKFNVQLAKSPVSEKVINIGFVGPWEIPKLLRSTTVLVHLEHNFPIPIHSPIQPYEAIATGTPLILSKEMYRKIVHRFPGTRGKFSVVENPAEKKELVQTISSALINSAASRENAESIHEEFLKSNSWERGIDQYIMSFERLARKKWLRRFLLR